MLAMALLLPGGHLGGVGGNAREVGGSGEGVLTPPTVPDGFRWGVETGELAHLVGPPIVHSILGEANTKSVALMELSRSLWPDHCPEVGPSGHHVPTCSQ